MKYPFTDHHILSFLKNFSSEPLDGALQGYFRRHKSLGASDRKTIGNTLYGMMRWKSFLDAISSDFSKQLAFYKKFEKNQFQVPSSFPKWTQLGVPEFLYIELCKTYGEKETEALCHLFQSQAPLTIRANLLKTSRENLLPLFPDASACQHAPQGIQFCSRKPLFSLPEFKQGLFEVQDEGSQLVANLISARPGDLVLDFCAGSGGKTLAFAPSMQGKGQIYLHDIRPSILNQARRRLKRAGIQNAQCLSSDHPQLPRLKGKCDWVLIDVPCSGTGTLRRNPEQKWRINAPMLDRLVQQQRAIAQNALSYLSPKGKLVYSTCSLLPQENEDQVDYFLSHLPLSLTEPPLSLLPQLNGMDGFFAAIFTKREDCYTHAPHA